MPKAYILMADVVKSQSRPGKAGKVLMNDLKEVVEAVKPKYRGRFLSPITITLGDEFQAVIENLETAVNIILSIEEELIKRNKSIKLKYVVEYGDIDTEINSKIAYEMLGPALTHARNHLINSKKEKDKRVSFFLPVDKHVKLLENQFLVITSFIDSWKQRDYLLIAELLKTDSYQQVAAVLSKEPSLVWKRQRNLKMKQYVAIKESVKYIAGNLL